jgi:hypothetical protein
MWVEVRLAEWIKRGQHSSSTHGVEDAGFGSVTSAGVVFDPVSA